MKKNILFVIVFTSKLLFGNLLDQVPFEGPFNMGLEGVIEAGTLQTKQTDVTEMEKEVRQQLSFMVGALNGMGGTLDLYRLEIKMGEREEKTGKVSYSAKVFLSWPKNYQLPQVVGLPVPSRGDAEGINNFYKNYSHRCSENPGSSELSKESFFYYYRPRNNHCPLSSNPKPLDVSVPVMKVGVSSLNTQGKSPEYGKIWEDGELTVTIIAGTNEHGVTGNHDIGVQQYNQLYQRLRSTFGPPVAMNVSIPPQAVPGFQYPDIEMTWELRENRKLNLNIHLIDKYQLLSPTPKFRVRLQKRIETSDLISYNGHSGLGVNIDALVGLGKYAPLKYQVFYFNGCDTFSYVDNRLALEHQKVNPEEGPYKFVDFISNSMPSPFQGFSSSNFALMNAMLKQQGTYKHILSQFSSMQRAVVMGEEDNNWPDPF